MKNVMRLVVMVVVSSVVSIGAFAQNYTSQNNGSWTAPANWSNTSGWGTEWGSGTISVNHNVTIAGNYNSGSATLNISSGKTLTINGNMTVEVAPDQRLR